MRTLTAETGHARLVAQIYAEAALSPPLAAIVQQQLAAMRAAVATLIAVGDDDDPSARAEAFDAVCSAYSQRLAVRGDLDPAPYVAALSAIIKPAIKLVARRRRT